MPPTLAAAFIAALAVVLAHLVYQMGAPLTLRRMTLDEYIVERKDDYSKHRSFDAVPEAMNVLAGENRRNWLLRSSVGYEDIFRLEGDELIHYLKKLTPFEQEEVRELLRDGTYDHRMSPPMASKEEIHSALSKIDEARDIETTRELEHQKNMAIIARAAEIEYIRIAETNWPVTILAALLYVLAIYLIFSILVNQTLSVMNAAGMESPASVLEWWKTRHAS